MLQVKVNDSSSHSVEHSGDNWYLNGKQIKIDVLPMPSGVFSVLLDGKSYNAILEGIDHKTKEVKLSIDGITFNTTIQEPIDQLLSKMGLDKKSKQGADSVKAPMPGMVLKFLVSQGQAIKKGDGLVILEAMKMENVLKANADGVVKSIKIGEKTAVEKGAVLIELES